MNNTFYYKFNKLVNTVKRVFLAFFYGSFIGKRDCCEKKESVISQKKNVVSVYNVNLPHSVHLFGKAFFSKAQEASIQAINNINPTLALTLNFNNVESLTENAAKIKLSRFSALIKRKYGNQIKGYAVMEHENSNIHFHLSINFPQTLTNDRLITLENELSTLWTKCWRSGTINVREIYSNGWAEYCVKDVKNFDQLIPV